ncbi:putative deacetylase LmbE-like domain-containing protein [Melampsora americana]|nr:putative deacetylase LmbE-like domain-containing protein [Melampsora americana]
MSSKSKSNQITSPPLSPLFEDSSLDSSNLIPDYHINKTYGDREDVIAEEEELRQELSRLDLYPPPSHPNRAFSSNPLIRNSTWFFCNPISFLASRGIRSKLNLLICFLLVWPMFWWIVTTILSDHSSLFPISLRNSKSTLIIVAHPDDECLFFGPSIISILKKTKTHGALLVLSSGNHYGLGEIRRIELKASCHELGIREDRCDVMEISSVQDDPVKWWPSETITKVVKEHLDKWMIDSIVTFDNHGISGHINHRAVSAAVTQLSLSLNATRSINTSSHPNPNPTPSLYILKSVFVLRKYSGLYDLPFTLISFIPSLLFGPNSQITLDLVPGYDSRTEQASIDSEKRRQSITLSFEKGLLINNLRDYFKTRHSFWKHRSQMVWDRHLYMILSRYMYFNTIERVI